MPKNCLLGLTVQIVSICNLKSQFGGGWFQSPNGIIISAKPNDGLESKMKLISQLKN
jgi:hypothetical protein